MQRLVDGAKSRELEERTRAVDELLSLREAVSIQLIKIVSQANDGRLDSDVKAIALFLMGELRLLQCQQILVAEKDWKRDPKDLHEWAWLNIHEGWGMDHFGFPARTSLGRAGFGPSASRLVEQRSAADLSKYPTLRAALKVLSDPEIPGDPSTGHDDPATVATCWCGQLRAKGRRAEEAVLEWYRFVCKNMYDVLKPSAVYPNEIRSTAAYLLGELRTRCPTQLMWNIDMDDETGTCDRYAETIKVETTTPRKPCVVALLKARLNVDAGLGRIAGENLSQYSNRTLLMRTLLTIDPQRTRETYRSMVAAREDPQRWGGDNRRRSEQLQRLRSVEDMINIPHIPGSQPINTKEAAKDDD